ncbi:Uncharacterised protein [Burkholderia pseudomallei]|nr:Uncharacterised protein [Burkholderia pseudomallei]CAJ9545578.1 Uncharacterised protein [Burkholderia pseudomallei]CAJ9907715.1 Uncharacterised protein [Burkholderia pseudomallei]
MGIGSPFTIRVLARDRLVRASSMCWVATVVASVCLIATLDRASTLLRDADSDQKPSPSTAIRNRQNVTSTPSRPDASLILLNMKFR